MDIEFEKKKTLKQYVYGFIILNAHRKNKEFLQLRCQLPYYSSVCDKENIATFSEI